MTEELTQYEHSIISYFMEMPIERLEKQIAIYKDKLDIEFDRKPPPERQIWEKIPFKGYTKMPWMIATYQRGLRIAEAVYKARVEI
jgi:hypothetical protein